MGTLAASSFHSLTDKVVAIIQKDLDGYSSELSAATINNLAVLADSIGDPGIEALLMPTALGVDKYSYPENYQYALPNILARSDLRAFAIALNSMVQNADGGSYASLAAYLLAASAKCHPLVGELFRKAIGDDALFGTSPTGVFSPIYAARRPTKFYAGTAGSLADDTTDAGSAATADVTLFAANGDEIQIGSTYKFNKIVIALSTLADSTITPTVKYWNGNAWTAVSGLTDNSAGLTKNDTIEFTLPTDWARSYKDSGGTALGDKTPLYYICITRTAGGSVTQVPVGTCVSIIPAATVLDSNGNQLGVDQPPLAIARITGTNTLVLTALNTVPSGRWQPPVSTVILRALTSIGSNLTVTLAYTDQAGAATGSAAQSSWTAPAALGTKVVALTSSDGLTAARSASSVVTAATQGVFTVETTALRTPAL